MQKFDLTIFRQSRIIIGLFFSPVVLIGLMMLCVTFQYFLIGILFFLFYLWALYYFVIGHLTIISKEDKLEFKWRKKRIFNYKEIEPVNIKDIKSIVIDNGLLLRKIKTTDRIILINTTKIKQRDIQKFLNHLSVVTEQNAIRKIDSWDEWADKGYLKTAYRVNNVILILATILILVSVFIVKGLLNPSTYF